MDSDALEIQNVSSKPVNVTGWTVAASDTTQTLTLLTQQFKH